MVVKGSISERSLIHMHTYICIRLMTALRKLVRKLMQYACVVCTVYKLRALSGTHF